MIKVLWIAAFSIFIFLVFAKVGAAHRGYPLISTFEAEETFMLTKFARINKIEDVNCQGIRIQGYPYKRYRHFLCTAQITKLVYGEPGYCQWKTLVHSTPTGEIVLPGKQTCKTFDWET